MLFLLACTPKHMDEVDYNCINISIPRDTAYVTQKVNYKNDFQIEVVGYSAYCYGA